MPNSHLFSINSRTTARITGCAPLQGDHQVKVSNIQNQNQLVFTVI